MRSSRLPALAITLSLAAACAPSKSSPPPSQPQEAANVRAIEIGDVPPSFALDSLNGAGRASLDAWRGDVVIVVFWATWSEPDKVELVHLADIRKRRAREPFHIVGVSIDDEATSLPEFARTYGIEFPIVWEADRKTTNRWRPWADPSTYLLDKKGVVRFVHHGFHDGEDKDIERELDELLR